MSRLDPHLMTVLRYVERNALRANLVETAEQWRWGSLRWRTASHPPFRLTASPIELPTWWKGFVNQPQTAAELAEIRTSVNRQRPFGDPEWVLQQARDADLAQSLSPRGRPRKRRRGTVS